MKKWKAAWMALALTLALTACGGKQGTDSSTSAGSETDTSEIESSTDAQSSADTQSQTGDKQSQDSTQASEVDMHADSEEAKKAYDENVQDFTPITMEEIQDKQDKKETFFVYAGFRDCPYCRALSPYLKEAVKEKGLEVFYLDTKGNNPDFNDFAGQLGIEYVPSIFSFKEGEVKATDDFKEPYNLDSAKQGIDKIMQ